MFTLTFINGLTARVEGYILPPVTGLEDWQFFVYDDGVLKDDGRFEPSGKYTVGELRTQAHFDEIIESTVQRAERKFYKLIQTATLDEWKEAFEDTIQRVRRMKERHDSQMPRLRQQL